jgi:hypothetical protein
VVTLVDHIHLGLREPPCPRALLKENVHLGVGDLLCLWRAERAPGDREHRDGKPDESRLSLLEVGGGRVNEIGLNCVCHQTGELVRETRQGDGLRAQPRGRYLCSEAKRLRAEAKRIKTEPDNRERRLGSSCCLVLYVGQHADEEQVKSHRREAPQDEGAASERYHKDPRAAGSHECNGAGAKVKPVRVGRAQTGLGEDLRAAVRKRLAGQGLGGEDHAGNLGATEVCPFEAVPQTDFRLDRLFEL